MTKKHMSRLKKPDTSHKTLILKLKRPNPTKQKLECNIYYNIHFF